MPSSIAHSILASKKICADSDLTDPNSYPVLKVSLIWLVQLHCAAAREVLQAIFFVPRGSPASVIRKDIAPKINAIHAIFKLDVGKALMEKDHLVGKEYEWLVGGAQVRCFPLPGVQSETIVMI